MALETDIINNALDLSGKDRIADINDATDPVAIRAKAIFYSELDATLRDHWWNCAKTRAELSATATAPAFGWDYAYQLPPDALKVRLDDCYFNVPDTSNFSNSTFNSASWEREGRYILTNLTPPLKIQHIRRITNAAEIDSDLRSAFEYRLASRFAAMYLHDDSKSTKMLNLYSSFIESAKQNDGQEGTAKPWQGTRRYTRTRNY